MQLPCWTTITWRSPDRVGAAFDRRVGRDRIRPGVALVRHRLGLVAVGREDDRHVGLVERHDDVRNADRIALVEAGAEIGVERRRRRRWSRCRRRTADRPAACRPACSRYCRRETPGNARHKAARPPRSQATRSRERARKTGERIGEITLPKWCALWASLWPVTTGSGAGDEVLVEPAGAALIVGHEEPAAVGVSHGDLFARPEREDLLRLT